ncbi:hypothetical protein CCAND38_100012 [Capnocytophaga canis]|uniref:Uncharacterized protein n=1 Tax=Capnocytophaga canis TaxID=1848903 RepID=A0A0B7I0R1_9FLAO|nr:hypothetical protein CCAND38_100012 [Capnocytophaga canis]
MGVYSLILNSGKLYKIENKNITVRQYDSLRNIKKNDNRTSKRKRFKGIGRNSSVFAKRWW